MKSRSAQHFWLAMCLIAGTAVHWTEAGEKIQFSTNKKAKDGQANKLAIQTTKPALPTLDFTRMGGRPSKAEEMATVAVPPPQADPDLNDPQEKKDDKDWLSTYENRNRTGKEGKDSKDGKNRDKSKDKDRDRDNGTDDRRENDPNNPDRDGNNPYDPYSRDRNRDPLGRLNLSGSNTNKILFGSANQRDKELFRPERPEGAPENRMGLPPAAGLRSREQDRTSTLERLGLEKPATGGTAASGNNGSVNSLFSLGSYQNPGSAAGNNSGLNPLGPSSSMRDDGVRQAGGRDSVFKSGLMSEVGSLGLGQGNQPKAYEAPKYDRKPAVLPIPHRKF